MLISAGRCCACALAADVVADTFFERVLAGE
jgi:hypothetical protein